MDEAIRVEVLIRSALLAIGIIGALVGIDLILGAHVIKYLKKLLDKSLHFEHIIIEANPRMIAGVLFLIISVVIIFLLRRP